MLLATVIPLLLSPIPQAVPSPPAPPLWGRQLVMTSLRALGEPDLPTEAQARKSARLVIAPPFPAWRVVVNRPKARR